jgi:cytochrome c oxidase subunit III
VTAHAEPAAADAAAEHAGGAPAESGKSPQFHVAHHFDTATTQFDSGRMGVWIFLVTEILFFGGMFCSFAVFRSWYFEAFKQAHEHLDKVMGGINTVVLICSSLTMALGVRCAQRTKRKATVVMLALTILFACTFLVIKYFEYHHKLEEGLLPGKFFGHPWFNLAETSHIAGSPNQGIFFAVYFMMTGVHGLHVAIGIGLIAWILRRAARGEFSSRYYAPVEGVGLYWHLVDLIWIYLFPLLYLVGH